MKLFKFLLLLLIFSPVVNAEILNSEKLTDENLHSELIKTAIKFDVFNQRCRGVSMAKNFVKVNRLYLSKYDITVNNYIKVYLSQDPRKAKKDLQDKMIAYISEQGGCGALRKKRTRKQFKKRQRQLFQQVEQSAWIPEKTRKR